MRRFSTVVMLCVALLASARADKPAATEAQARFYYQEGTKWYNLGKFAKAIENYEKAYEKKQDPVFLYNIGQAYRMSNDFAQAVFFYKSFLRNLPDAPNRAEVESRIKELEDQLSKQRATAGAPPTGPVEPGNTPSPSSEPPPGVETDEPDETDPKIPSPETVAESSDAAHQPAGQSGPTDRAAGKPIYKKWWFWAGVGAVAVGTVAIVVATSGGSGGSDPDTDFGTRKAF